MISGLWLLLTGTHIPSINRAVGPVYWYYHAGELAIIKSIERARAIKTYWGGASKY
jgi:hypothetical protein